MATFDPKPFGPIPDDLSVVPTKGESWSKKWANWWGGATIASPTLPMTATARFALNTVRRLLAEDPDSLGQYMAQEMDYTRSWVRDVLCENADTPVILDASGTAAILTATRILSHLADQPGEFWSVTTDEGGSLVPATLKGRNPNELENVMFQPTSALFYDADSPVLEYPQGMTVTPPKMVRIAGKTNAQILDEIKAAVAATSGPGCIMLPHVTKTGRVLPIREVGAFVAELREAGRQVFYIVDDIQGMGRLPIEAVSQPTSYCDAYLFGSSKALGGMLIASGIVVRKQVLESFAEKIRAGNQAPCFPHFQFSNEWQERIGEGLLKPSAVSLPEIVSMREGLRQLWIRGEGETFADRRRFQLAHVRALRKQVVDALTAVPGVSVLEATDDQPLVPSIVCFRCDKPGWTPGSMKKALQEGNPIVTPSAPIGRYVRLDIPEYRQMPSVEVLAAKVRKLLSE